MTLLKITSNIKFHSHLLPLKQKTLLKLNLANHIRLYFIPYWLHFLFFKGVEKFRKIIALQQL